MYLYHTDHSWFLQQGYGPGHTLENTAANQFPTLVSQTGSQHPENIAEYNHALCVTRCLKQIESMKQSCNRFLGTYFPEDLYQEQQHVICANICPCGFDNLVCCVWVTLHTGQCVRRKNSPQAPLVVEPMLGLTVLGRKVVQAVQAWSPMASLYVFVAH